MNNIINSILFSIQQKNWHGALTLSLILPDICSSMENSTKRNPEKYADWFENYMGTKYRGFLTGYDCYALRCSFLHEGHSNLDDRRASENQKIKDILDKIRFIENGSHCQRFSSSQFGDLDYDDKDFLILSANHFCLDFVQGAKIWMNDSSVEKNFLNLLKIEPSFSIGNSITIS